ncbi:transglutaminase family protein [Thermodesulfobacteriota bacterium]
MTKKILKIIMVFICIAFPAAAWGKLHYYSGTMDAEFEITHTIEITVPSGLNTLSYTTTLPENFSLPNSTQNITVMKFSYEGAPVEENYTDAYGCHYKKLTWINPSRGYINVTISYKVSSSSDWNKFVTNDPFPFNSSGLPASVTDFLRRSDEVQSDDSVFVNLADNLTKNITTQWEALKVLNGWVMDNIFYGTNPNGIDALSTIDLRYGKCSNFAHVALALIRASGIPARLAHGYSIRKYYELPTEDDPIHPDWGQGTHAWIEVYYPSLGWVPYDPQRDLHHVDTHRVLLGRGADTTGIVGVVSGSSTDIPFMYIYSYQVLDVEWITDDIDLSYIKSTDEIQSFSLSSLVSYTEGHAIIAPAGIGGIISPSGQVRVNDGSSQAFTITPDPDYDLDDVLVDGNPIGAVNSYIFNNVTEDHTIEALFVIDSDGDIDDDGLPDSWEQQIIDHSESDEFTSIQDVEPDHDFDGDGYTNLEEYEAETDPTDSSSHPLKFMPWIPLLLEGE